MPIKSGIEARVDAQDSVSELAAEVGRSRILATAYNHLRDVGAAEDAWTLKFELSWLPASTDSRI